MHKPATYDDLCALPPNRVGEKQARVAPFDAVTLDLGGLWA
jgi:hypothetical protein